MYQNCSLRNSLNEKGLELDQLRCGLAELCSSELISSYAGSLHSQDEIIRLIKYLKVQHCKPG